MTKEDDKKKRRAKTDKKRREKDKLIKKKWAEQEATKARGQRASARLYKEGLDSTVIKFTIDGFKENKEGKMENASWDFYLTIATFEGHVDLIDLTLSGAHEHNIRALIESAFRLSTQLLRNETSLEKIIKHWEGYRFEPHGKCKQLVESYGYDRPTVRSPLDCVAKILEKRFLK